MGSRCEMPLSVLVPGLRRPRDEDDTNDLESSPPRRRKLVPMVDLTEGARLVHMTQCLNIVPENEYSHTPDTRFSPLIPNAQPRIQSSSQKCFQPFSLGPIHKGQAARPDSVFRTSKTVPPAQFSMNVSPGTSLSTRLRALGSQTASSPISAPRPRVNSPLQRVVGRDKSPHSLFNVPGILPFSRTTNQSARATVSSRWPAEKYYELELDSILHNGHPLRARKTVELHDGTFLRIASIKNRISDGENDIIFLQGSKFQRAREFLGLLPLKRNEVAMCSLSENVPLSEVLKPRILILTNAAFPKYRVITGNDQTDEREGRLICRWRIKIVSKQEGYMWRLQQHEVDENYQMDDSEQRKKWRGGLVEIVTMLQDGALQDTPCEDLFEQEGFVEWSARKKDIVDLTTQKQSVKEIHHTAIVTNHSSLDLKQTSYTPFKHYDLPNASGLKSSRYEATIDSRTPAGRFLGYFQGTYTPNSNTSPSSSSASRSNPAASLGPRINSSLQTTNKFSGTLAAQPVNSNPWNPNKRKFRVPNSSGISPFNTQQKKQGYKISGRPQTYAEGNFRSSTFHGSTVTPKSIFRSNVYNNLKSCTPSSKDLGPFNSQPLISIRNDALSVKSKWSLVPQDITLSESPSKSFPEKRDSLQGFNNSLKSPQPPQSVFKPGFSPPTRHKYKFGDAFCGGGGMSSGARSAGFANSWSFDFNIDAVATYRVNFPSCKTYHISANEFVALPPEDLLVDVVHLSPPCQPHSPAHTIAGKDDDRNEASLFCIKECLEASRPRIVTLEQTDGILNRQEWFRSLVMCFTDLGFSVSWKVLHGVEYGLPQTRKRLFLLAASPGELLPDFPTPKYAHPTRDKDLNSSLPPPRTVRDAISYISYSSTCHQPLYFPNGFRPSPVDFDQPLRATILASGGPYDVHPSGLRPFTPRELACLQTFPVTHDFAGSVFQKKKQIGNAVPPVLAEALLAEVRKTLEKADRERSNKAGDDVRNGKGKGRGKGKWKGKEKGKGKGKGGEKEKEDMVAIPQPLGGKEREREREGSVTILQSLGKEKSKEKEKNEKKLQTTINIPDDHESRVTILQSPGGNEKEKEKEKEKELQTAINIPDDGEGRVTMLQSPGEMEMEMELQTAINIPDDGEGRVTMLQSPGEMEMEMELQTAINIPDDGEGRVTMLQSPGEMEMEMELQTAINIPDDGEDRVTMLQSPREIEMEMELQTTINIPDDGEGRVTMLQSPREMEMEMELQTTINIPDDEEGKITILQSLGGIVVVTVD